MSTRTKRSAARVNKIRELVEQIGTASYETGFYNGYRANEGCDTPHMREKESAWQRHMDELTKKLRPALNALIRETRADDTELREGHA